MGRKTSRGVIKYAVFKEFNKIMKGGFMESRDFTDILKQTRHTVLFLRGLDISKCR